MSNNFFNINRFGLLFRRQILLNSKSMYVALSAVAGAILLIFFLMGIGEQACNYYNQAGLFYPIFFIGGYILSSKVFHEMSDFRTGYQYLTLPVSNFERLFAGWLYSSLFYSIVGIIAFYILSSIACGLSALVMGFNFIPFNFNFKYVVLISGIYMVTQTIFLFGGATFKKQPFLKTLLALIIFGFSMGFISGLLGWGIIGEFQTYHFNFNENDLTPEFIEFMETVFPKLAQILFWGVIGPFFLVVSYFKLKESEV